jgi:hypothetical protein
MAAVAVIYPDPPFCAFIDTVNVLHQIRIAVTIKVKTSYAVVTFCTGVRICSHQTFEPALYAGQIYLGLNIFKFMPESV